MKRLFDLVVALLFVVILFVPIVVVTILVRFTSKGPVIYWSVRVGKKNKTFKMPKFRTMIVSTPTIATHMLDAPDSYLSPIGGFLRRTSLDELPQLFSVIRGDMSFVGPRPALFNQEDLISLRTYNGVSKITPGVTGWAQINGRDQLSIVEKVDLDLEYLNKQSFFFDIKILLKTLIKIVKNLDVLH